MPIAPYHDTLTGSLLFGREIVTVSAGAASAVMVSVLPLVAKVIPACSEEKV